MRNPPWRDLSEDSLGTVKGRVPRNGAWIKQRNLRIFRYRVTGIEDRLGAVRGHVPGNGTWIKQ